jgi:hypothetical protein
MTGLPGGGVADRGIRSFRGDTGSHTGTGSPVSSRDGRTLGLAREGSRNSGYDAEADQIPVVDRKTFVAEFGEKYTPAHVTFIGPTQRGKTTLCFQLLHAVLTRHKKWKVRVLHGKIKGRDHTISDWAKKSNYRVVRSWPPTPTPRPKHWKRNVKGYIVRPLRKEESAKEEERILREEFQKTIRSGYHSTGAKRDKIVITLVDERAQADKDLRMSAELDAPLQRGLPDNPEWNNIQRGKWVSYHCFDAPEHIFIFKSDDSSNNERYAELGCADPQVVERVLSELKTKKVKTGGTISQALYIRRSDRHMCIVDT